MLDTHTLSNPWKTCNDVKPLSVPSLNASIRIFSSSLLRDSGESSGFFTWIGFNGGSCGAIGQIAEDRGCNQCCSGLYRACWGGIGCQYPDNPPCCGTAV